RHVTRVETDGPVSRCDLERIVGELMTHRLDRSHPLWHLDVVEDLDDDSMAVVWRIHHCMADGATSMRMGSCMLWSQHPDLAVSPAVAWTPSDSPGLLQLLAAGLAARAHRQTGDRPTLPEDRPAKR